MAQQLINGRHLADKIKDQIAQTIFEMNGQRPNLAIILVGNRPDSEIYVRHKQEEAKKVGIDTHLYNCQDDISEEELLSIINFLNNDETIDGILLQLPLPKHLNTDRLVNAISLEKDIDGFTAKNLACLKNNDPKAIIPPVFGVILTIVAEQQFDLAGQKTLIVGNEGIFSNNLAEMLGELGAQVELLNDITPENRYKLDEAKLLITALGKPHSVKPINLPNDYLIIDIGITKKDSKVYGDVDLSSINPQINGWATPVPGGVGPL
ncbi:MAG TPA: bifunctional 5,10-methylenetetrahydrofolate dehydrogenase/5,10-methenyltetrahydrofolate cyclohydrolase, partial [bacterium]|nr:bifunctional 5,10-methylenetetrahydrofolate dehydrogenase/5,10-methenyltetrahydrofolate cyclohydrolase [bacterium]